MVLAEREDVDVADNDHLLVVFREDGVANDVWRARRGQKGIKEWAQGLCAPGRRSS